MIEKEEDDDPARPANLNSHQTLMPTANHIRLLPPTGVLLPPHLRVYDYGVHHYYKYIIHKPIAPVNQSPTSSISSTCIFPIAQPERAYDSNPPISPVKYKQPFRPSNNTDFHTATRLHQLQPWRAYNSHTKCLFALDMP